MRALPVTLAVLCLAACGKGSKSAPPAAPPAAARPARPTAPAEYTVIVKSTWTKTTHPFEYPSGAHFSGMIGASHNAKYSGFAVGRRPTPGLERLSEEGKHSPLDTEIQSAIDQGNALMEFESGGLKNWKDSMVSSVRVDSAHPLVDVVNMVAPKTLTLPAYDSGGDDGKTYKAPDRDANPKKPTTRLADRHFVIHGRVKPVAILIFVRKS